MRPKNALMKFYPVLLLLSAEWSSARVVSPKNPLQFTTWVKANEDTVYYYPETAPDSTHAIPSLLARHNLGISFSGGGLRAASIGLGYLRALHTLNITSKARYISSNSGTSWLSIPYSFQQKVPINTFLGSYIPPEQLTARQLQQRPPPGSFDGVIADARFGLDAAVDALDGFVDSFHGRGRRQAIGAWSKAVGKAFLAPYDLNNDASSFTATGTAGGVFQAAATLPKGLEVYTYKPAARTRGGEIDLRPFPIILSAMINPNTCSASRYKPFEITPIYAGCPVPADYAAHSSGGGFVEPLGLNTLAPVPNPVYSGQLQQARLLHKQRTTAKAMAGTMSSSGQRNTSGTKIISEMSSVGELNMKARAKAAPVVVQHAAEPSELIQLQIQAKSEYLVPLKVVAGMSSSAMANVMQMVSPVSTEATRALSGTEVLSYWDQADFTSRQVGFGDGAGVDNLAITPLLRRRVSKIIACYAAVKSVRTTTAREWAEHHWDLAALFGASPSGNTEALEMMAATQISAQELNKQTQVFPTEGYYELFAALRHSAATGEPAHHLATYTVQTNSYQAIQGGWEVQVLWVISQDHRAWESLLPADIASQINSARSIGTVVDKAPLARTAQSLLSGVVTLATDFVERALGPDALQQKTDTLGLSKFPYLPIGDANYSLKLTQLMSQHASWQMLNLRQKLQQLLSYGDQ